MNQHSYSTLLTTHMVIRLNARTVTIIQGFNDRFTALHSGDKIGGFIHRFIVIPTANEVNLYVQAFFGSG